MYFYLSKILSFFTKPFSWILVLAIVSFFIRRKWLKTTFQLAALLLVLVFSNSFITNQALRVWETPTISKSDLTGQFEVGIVLGGGMVLMDTSTGESVWRWNTDRILKAVELYKSGKIKKILVSGGEGSLTPTGFTEADLIKTFLVRNYIVPDTDILVDGKSRNTHENAVESKKILHEKAIKGQVLLITSAIHMPRSLGCFRKVEMLVTPFATDRLYYPRKGDFEYYLIPDFDNFFTWNKLFHEWIGWFTYRIAGYI